MSNNDFIPLRSKHNIKPNRYWVSNSGQVYWKNKDGEYKKMQPFTTRDGYKEYVLTRVDGTKQHIQGQIIVIASFKGYPSDKTKTQVNHINGKRYDCRPDNLEWVTPKENIAHSFKKLGKVVWNSPKKKTE